jgi:hypothetical protein
VERALGIDAGFVLIMDGYSCTELYSCRARAGNFTPCLDRHPMVTLSFACHGRVQRQPLEPENHEIEELEVIKKKAQIDHNEVEKRDECESNH